MENSARFAQVVAAAAAFIAGRPFRRVRGLGVCGGLQSPILLIAYLVLGASGLAPFCGLQCWLMPLLLFLFSFNTWRIDAECQYEGAPSPCRAQFLAPRSFKSRCSPPR